MTFRVRFFAEQAYFSFVKESLANPIVDHEKAVEPGAVCVVSLNCALEAIANTLLNDHSQTEDWEKQSLHSKLEELLVLAGIAKDWGRHPLQKIKELNSIRNWLVHYKDSDIGLINSDSQWISD